jgi:hypothetical protein
VGEIRWDRNCIMETPTEQVESAEAIPATIPFAGVDIPVEDYTPLPGPSPETQIVAPVEPPAPEKPAKKPHHAFGDPTKPLWKDIVGDMSNNGAIPISVWESSVLWLVKPFAMRNKWSGRELVKRAVRAVRRMTDQHPKVGEVLAVWDAMPPKQRNRVMSLDKALAEVEGISKDKLAMLILTGMKNEAMANAKAVQAAAIPDIMAASMDSIQTNAPTASSERVRHMETLGLISKQSKGSIVVNASASASGGSVKAKSFDSQLTELDDALDADYEMLPPGGGQKQIGDGQ